MGHDRPSAALGLVVGVGELVLERISEMFWIL
jgi:hypothetical protein